MQRSVENAEVSGKWPGKGQLISWSLAIGTEHLHSLVSAFGTPIWDRMSGAVVNYEVHPCE